MKPSQRLREQVALQARRMKKAERERHTLLAQTTYLGTLGIVFVLPVVVGAYVGAWLDGQAQGYSVAWTVSLLLIGVMLGAVNVYLLIRSKE